MLSPSQSLLEQDPQAYLDIIKNMDVFKEVNNKEYCSWYSNHVQALSYLAGTLESEYNANFFGSSIKNLDENIAIEILENLDRLGADLHMTNYYDENILDTFDINEKKLFKRINNGKFIEKVVQLYEK